MKKTLLVMLIVVMSMGMMFAQGTKDQAAVKGEKEIVILCKSMGNGFFDAVFKGSEEAVAELGGIKTTYMAPSQATAEGQIEIIESLIAQRVDGIAISANDADALIPVAKKAMAAGIKVISFDSGINVGGRIVDLLPSNAELIGRQQIQLAADLTGMKGDIAVLSASAQATNQNLWIDWMKEEIKDAKYSNMKLVEVVYGDDAPDKSYREATSLMKKYPNLKAIICPTTVGLLATAQAVKDAGMTGKVEVTGLGLPSEMKGYILDGTCRKMALWNPIDLGYTSTYILAALMDGTSKGSVGEVIPAGRMKSVKVEKDGLIYMSTPYVFNKDNIEQYAAIF
ncbi:rhamnose ABC transporter, rhamnose-binding protein [Sphaerochaeta pleomorpha str. Grapes]|uniref:Rhamnose ABC transporter, rhamnose-binding protein n=1 Tax=Sphaerochaeta pleomorpha (strain ATCC BAA-1885 / DSM 22778 / Grapes) TaxID=158190 RepID=G8QUN5_SPHPG|nr:rhamnose ABC transporter substrate-binding protein [Sphaerochaeta pleomorpha]AEV30343.1 rhamnose ABC transporter, rhamnose-binding protein [Sphaerochaeta pleomorpha str. Grapes]